MSTVVYVALGSRRVRGARRHASDRAAAGDSVLLVVTDAATRPEPGVTVHRVASAREAIHFLRDKLAGADLLIAGDPEAMPVADAARRRFPKLTVRTDPSPGAGRRPEPADLAVLTPWYPSPDDPFAGVYVRDTTAAVAGTVGRISILHNENWYYSIGGVAGKLVGVTLRRELAREPAWTTVDTPEGALTRVVTPQVTHGNYAMAADAQIERLRAALPGGVIDAPLIHAHTGHYAGVVAAALARPDARIVVTEHITFLDKVLAEPAARRKYGQMLARADRVLCVGRALYDQIADAFPQHVEKLRIVPNPIDFDRFAARPEPPVAPLRWLYVGRMVEHKGVRTLIDGFARIAADEPRATLTLVGSGPMEAALTKRIAELGLADRIAQRPPVAPEDVPALLHDHDVLVHASRSETFGVTVVEAVASGTPVMVAASPGPAETLAGLDGVAGVLFAVGDDPELVADAYRRLAAEWDGLDLISARELLRARYGREAVGAQLREVYRQVLAETPAVAVPETEAAPPEMPVSDDRITLVSINPPSVAVHKYVQTAREHGYGVDVITAEPGPWSRYAPDAAVSVHALGAHEERRLSRRLKRGLVSGLPRRALGFARGQAGKLSSPLPEALLVHAERGHLVLADRFDAKLYNRWYAVVRPRVLWKITRRRVLPQLDLAHTRRVVVHGMPGVTIGWGLAKREAGVPVGTELIPLHEDAARS